KEFIPLFSDTIPIGRRLRQNLNAILELVVADLFFCQRKKSVGLPIGIVFFIGIFLKRQHLFSKIPSTKINVKIIRIKHTQKNPLHSSTQYPKGKVYILRALYPSVYCFVIKKVLIDSNLFENGLLQALSGYFQIHSIDSSAFVHQ